MVHPIIDEYYNYNPYHSRSSKFVQDKGLVTNEKGTPGGASPTTTTGISNGDHKTNVAPSNLHDSLVRSHMSEMHSSQALSAEASRQREINSAADVRRLSSIRDPAKPQEQGNTKKKRRSLTEVEHQPAAQVQLAAQTTTEPSSSETGGAYGDPAKIAQYFPELTL
jgi:glutamine amidotransferase